MTNSASHYCLRPSCPDFNQPREYHEFCPACGKGWMYSWRFDPKRRLLIQLGPRGEEAREQVGSISAAAIAAELEQLSS